MGYKFQSRFTAALAGVVLLAGCAVHRSNPPSAPTPDAPPNPPGKLQVKYSTAKLKGGALKEQPTEVTLVRRETTGRLVAAQVGVNILMLALGGGFTTTGIGFSKNDLKGDRIEDAEDRANLQNPVSSTFIESLQAAVDAEMVQKQIGQDRSFRYPLVAGYGNARLIYDSLVGDQEPWYQLVLELDVYKRPEESQFKLAGLVPCSERSEPPQPLAYWAASSYGNVRQELDRMLAACQKKVLADLPRLLEP